MISRTLRLLQVEDNEDDILLLGWAIQRAGKPIHRHSATDGAQAFGFLENSPSSADLILLDIRLPEISGLELLQMIKARQPLVDIPVVMFSSSQHHSDISRASELGASAYIVKPATIEEWTKCVSILYDAWNSSSLSSLWPTGAA